MADHHEHRRIWARAVGSAAQPVNEFEVFECTHVGADDDDVGGTNLERFEGRACLGAGAVILAAETAQKHPDDQAHLLVLVDDQGADVTKR
jgi:hypothetical protein